MLNVSEYTVYHTWSIWEIKDPAVCIAWYMGVSKNNGTPKSSILVGFFIINHPLWGTPIFGNFGNIHILPYLFHLLLQVFGLPTTTAASRWRRRGTTRWAFRTSRGQLAWSFVGGGWKAECALFLLVILSIEISWIIWYIYIYIYLIYRDCNPWWKTRCVFV